MNTQELIEFLESRDFHVHQYTDNKQLCMEIETYAPNGVDMLFNIVPATVEQTIEVLESFDVEEEVDLHRQNELFRNNFTLRQALNDFEKFECRLTNIVKDLKKELSTPRLYLVILDFSTLEVHTFTILGSECKEIEKEYNIDEDDLDSIVLQYMVDKGFIKNDCDYMFSENPIEILNN